MRAHKKMLINKTYTIPIKRKAAPFEEGEAPILNIASFNPDQNPNIFSVVHKTTYQYSSKVAFSKHIYRLQPTNDLAQTVLNHQFSVSINNSEMHNFTGAFGNNASFVEIKESYQELAILSQSIVCVQEFSPKLDLLHQPRAMPLIWMPWDRIMMQAYLQPPELPESELFEIAEYAMSFVKKNHNDVFAVLNDINETIFREYAYMPATTTFSTTAYNVYKGRKGVCQDFANLFICMARLLNIPARYRVGYIFTHGNYENTLQSDASHAWVEIFLPYLGWLGFDPTNGCLAGKNHIKVACGRYYNDATPTTGTIFQASPGTTESLSTGVEVLLLNT